MQHPAEQVKKQYTEYKKRGKVKYTYHLYHPNKNTREHLPGISFGTDLFIVVGGDS